MENQNFAHFLNSVYQVKKSKNEKFSKRAFAKFLDLDSSILIPILNGKKTPGLKTAKKILQKIGVNNIVLEESLLLSLVDEKYLIPKTNTGRKEYAELTASWSDSAALSLLKRKPAVNSFTKLKDNLNLTHEEALDTIKRLEQMGHVEMDGDTIYFDDEVDQQLVQGAYKPNIHKIQSEYMDKAKETFEQRFSPLVQVTCTAVTTDPEKIEQAKEMVRSFRSKLIKFLHDEDSDILFGFNTQLYPISSNVEETKP